VSVDFDPSKSRWRVRWRKNGKQRSRRFASEAEAVAFDEARTLPQPTTAAAPLRTRAEGDAIYAYATKAGRRYRFVFRPGSADSVHHHPAAVPNMRPASDTR
jgi:hypothetical protein